eukprot:CAMPEP_0201571790 /NCGR_PEP_ID=MMETSP0190_2-20130828/14726_1 /ASSEMBLY_ACC=CAM_ASM_000263 /TAXON_ID=37353 /ORGANISM="Rosalina sp." /LENGTH=229 /DNA_ID=CAMNT_0047996813 /DNA_START=29 /DNA_END=718 /DNA_ORIENTATION=+
MAHFQVSEMIIWMLLADVDEPEILINHMLQLSIVFFGDCIYVIDQTEISSAEDQDPLHNLPFHWNEQDDSMDHLQFVFDNNDELILDPIPGVYIFVPCELTRNSNGIDEQNDIAYDLQEDGYDADEEDIYTVNHGASSISNFGSHKLHLNAVNIQLYIALNDSPIPESYLCARDSRSNDVEASDLEHDDHYSADGLSLPSDWDNSDIENSDIDDALPGYYEYIQNGNGS